MRDWQPIETAPEQTWIIAANWDERKRPEITVSDTYKTEDQQGNLLWVDWHFVSEKPPTHWIPMPRRPPT